MKRYGSYSGYIVISYVLINVCFFLNKHGKTICNLKDDFLILINFFFVVLTKSQKKKKKKYLQPIPDSASLSPGYEKKQYLRIFAYRRKNKFVPVS